jgi:hypothetical protein
MAEKNREGLQGGKILIEELLNKIPDWFFALGSIFGLISFFWIILKRR